MATKQVSGYCNVCQRQSLFQKEGINHVLHLILSIVTLGFWVLVWIALAINSSTKQPRCTTCGTIKSIAERPAVQPPIQAQVDVTEVEPPR